MLLWQRWDKVGAELKKSWGNIWRQQALNPKPLNIKPLTLSPKTLIKSVGSRFPVGGPNPLLGFIDLFVYLFACGAGLSKTL